MSSLVRLGDIAKISSGGTPSRSKPSNWGGDIPWVKTAQIQNRIITAKDIDEWITEEGVKNSSAKMVPKGTILMAMYGQGKTRGQVAILGLDATINQACAAITINDKANRDFVYQQLLFRYASIRNLSNSGSQENLSAGLIREIDFPLPPLSEQTAIAGLLANWDEAIGKNEGLVAAKVHRFEALSEKLYFMSEKKGKQVRFGSFLTESCIPGGNGLDARKLGSSGFQVADANGSMLSPPQWK